MAAPDPFRKLFLDQAQGFLNNEPGKEPLHGLLRMATPDLDADNDLNESECRKKLIKALKIRIHPDKHPGDTERATKIYQDVNSYIDRCVKNLPPSSSPKSKSEKPTSSPQSSPKKKKSTSSSPRSSIQFPFDFHVGDMWQYLTFDGPLRSMGEDPSPDVLSPMVGYQCVNSRGAIAHGQATTYLYELKNAEKFRGKSVREFFEKVGKGTKTLTTKEEIKDELMKRGPVVSVSFVPTKKVTDKMKHPEVLFSNCLGKKHPILIVGWKNTEHGQSWLAQPLKKEGQSYDNRHLAIPFDHYHIDDECMSPKSTFEDKPWQSGPYFDTKISETTHGPWRSWTKLGLNIPSAELEKLGDCLDGQCFHQAIQKKTKFTIRDVSKIAHSKKCYLEEVKYRKDCSKDSKKCWQIKVIYVPSK